MTKKDWTIEKKDNNTVVIGGAEFRTYISRTCLDCELRYTPVCKMVNSDNEKLECPSFHIWRQEGVRTPMSEEFSNICSDYALIFKHMYFTDNNSNTEGMWLDCDFEIYRIGDITINLKDMKYAVNNQVERNEFFQWLGGYGTKHGMSLRQWCDFRKISENQNTETKQ